MTKIALMVLAVGLLAVSEPVWAQQAGESMQNGPYISAADAASHKGGMRERMARAGRHHRHHRHHHRTR